MIIILLLSSAISNTNLWGYKMILTPPFPCLTTPSPAPTPVMKTRWNHLEYNCLNIPRYAKWPLINGIRSDIEASALLQLAIYQRWCRSWIKYDTLGQVISHILRRKNSHLIEELILYGVSIIRRVSQWHVLPLIMRHYHVKCSCSTFRATWPGVSKSALNL